MQLDLNFSGAFCGFYFLDSNIIINSNLLNILWDLSQVLYLLLYKAPKTTGDLSLRIGQIFESQLYPPHSSFKNPDVMKKQCFFELVIGNNQNVDITSLSLCHSIFEQEIKYLPEFFPYYPQKVYLILIWIWCIMQLVRYLLDGALSYMTSFAKNMI